MINTKALRAYYKEERQKMTKDAQIGSIILTVLGVIFIALVVRGFCLAIVAVHSFIK